MTRNRTLLMLIASASVASACSDGAMSDARDERDGGSRVGAPSVAAAPVETLTPIALHVPDISCRLCARPIEHGLRKIGVRDVEADVDTKWVTGRFDPERLTPDEIRARVEELRFRVARVRVD